MLEIISVEGERNVMILEPKDALEVVERCCGYEMAGYLRDVLAAQDLAKYEAKQRVNSDIRSYEATLDDHRCAFSDLLDLIDQMQEVLNAKRINRDKIQDIRNEMRGIINEYA